MSAEFKIHQHGGLALSMFEAAGMQGSDSLNDYLLRSEGSIGVVTAEDVRNYHWELYREMFDTRNDLVSHAVIKNPWFYRSHSESRTDVGSWTGGIVSPSCRKKTCCVE